ncbi:bifunctional (p)ppGpp synthetase/guanosine-3',5'-bis(diphosphate) 3'-pyrophosphohydrolase [Iamia sp. SCSIO 61187]|uniref:RelA/SpoT family protein n=1 Tax=Iamia sp. SCSIO 61187 TaxID=2722752 RepID=UPI001C632FF5|nr:bifunctional (p)ppGpp synthetase/guanosine-3',5'-bis(diphosphate) 3'-pyrophosphohydrolase [Iamia sp. SCSIO 61187]QYG93389.1 bifunctional (p)ppGpp synthetase/guanosine-3',5'-bis(diphosphate) 3'-pyrophosphohydrolase [Iamia sp. SCSIO 61187]
MPTVDRVLPWRRSAAPRDEVLAPLLHDYRAQHPKGSTATIVKAYDVAKAAHEGQRRKSGEAYVTHPLAVARIVAGLGLDDITISAALLHDAVEDTGMSLADVEREFGAQVRHLVDGVTKIERLQFDSKEAQQAATVRKVLVAMSRDLRVIIIKLADRLHNMRTLAAMPDWKQQRVAQETLDVYAPLAHRLGMQDLRQQLEDLAFATQKPKHYAEIDHMVTMRAPERDLYLMQVLEEVRGRIKELRIDADVTGRPKHYWSIYEKMVVKGRGFDDIFDLVGIRVLVDQVKDCYAALGSIHATWTPVQGRFKDYIAHPKFNLYQSLHTTVVGPQGKPLEVQIRTREMHGRAEVGVAAHWSYKEPGSDGDQMLWLNRIVEWQSEISDPERFLDQLKVDLDQDEVYVFTPKGRIITLVNGATPIDFAYAVHTEVGHTCAGAKVNGRLVPLDHTLTSGDTCEIVTSRTQGAGPKRDWLQIVKTPKAANRIRQWYSRERREDAIETGREGLDKALRREGLPIRDASTVLADIAHELNYVDLDSLHAAIGEHHVSPESVANRIAKRLHSGDPDHEEQLPITARAPRARRPRSTIGVHVEGLDDVMVRLAKCCTPVPGDEIMGFVTRGRGVSVHRTDCANAVSLSQGQGGRLIEVEWDQSGSGSFTAAVEIKALDRPRLLGDTSSAFADLDINILACESRSDPDRDTTMRFEVELGDPSHLDSVLRAIRGLDGVFEAYRVMPGRNTP